MSDNQFKGMILLIKNERRQYAKEFIKNFIKKHKKIFKLTSEQLDVLERLKDDEIQDKQS